MSKLITEIAAILLSAVAAGLAFDYLGVPIAWMLGPMAAGVVIAFLSGRVRQIPGGLQTGAQVILGISTGLTFPVEALGLLGSRFPALLIAILITGSVSLVNGWLLNRWAGVDRATGFLGSVPGAAAGMVAMSQEVGADARIVAVLQYLRLLTVAFLSPVLVEWSLPEFAPSALTARPLSGTQGVLPAKASLPVLLLAGLIGLWFGRRVKIPSATFLGPLLMTLAVTWTGLVHGTLPRLFFTGAVLVIGVGVGIQFDWPTVRGLRLAALIAFAQVVALMAVCVALGYGLALTTGIGISTAILGTVPGAMEAQIAAAVTMGAEAPLVVSMQMIRVMIVIVTGPWIAKKLTRAVKARNHEGS